VSLFRHRLKVLVDRRDVWEQLYKTLAFQDGVRHVELLQRDTTLEQEEGRLLIYYGVW
jgi:hypothetical protein